MNTIPSLMALLLILLNVGCTQMPNATSLGQKSWTQQLTKVETTRFETIAWDAAHSSPMLEQFNRERIYKYPIKLSKDGMQCHLDQESLDTVLVAIPTGGIDGWHPFYMGVTIHRGTYEVLGLEESFWP